MEKYINYAKQFNNNDITTWVKSTLSNYLKKNDDDQRVIEHILDYLNNTKKCIIGMQYEVAKSNSLTWIKAMNKKARNIIETEVDVSVEINFNNGFKLVKLVGKPAFQREGKLMSNCVASYFGKNDCNVYSLRDTNNNPHCTIEVVKRDGVINQIKGKGNGSIHHKYIGGVLASLKFLGMNVRDSEMVNLGYEILNKDTTKYIESNFDGVKYVTFNNKKFFYKYSKLTLKR